MKIPSVIASQGVKLLSGLANNDDCLTAMVAKDWIGDGATVLTYKKQGGQDDWIEKGIEEYGTGLVWLFGIPGIKYLIDKTIYKGLNLNPNFDPRLLTNEDTLKAYTQFAKGKEKELLQSLSAKNAKLSGLFTNKSLYKGLAVGKFIVATALSAFALTKIIKAKQNTTTKRIERDLAIQNEQLGSVLLQRSLNKNNNFSAFSSKKSDNIAFKGGLQDVMFNPIKNTMILDGVIAATRLKNARKGEHAEVAFKEICQIFFIYGIAKPIQDFFEKLGKSMQCPIELDPKVLFDKNLQQQLDNSGQLISELLTKYKPEASYSLISKLLKKENGSLSIESLSKILKDNNFSISKETLEKIFKMYNFTLPEAELTEFLKVHASNPTKNLIKELSDMKVDSSLIQLLVKNGVISLNSEGSGISFLKEIDEASIVKTLSNLQELSGKMVNLSKIKNFKTFAVIANVLIAAGIMGVAQPMASIILRKIANKGDNRNPAIVAQEQKMKMAYQA